MMPSKQAVGVNDDCVVGSRHYGLSSMLCKHFLIITGCVNIDCSSVSSTMCCLSEMATDEMASGTRGTPSQVVLFKIWTRQSNQANISKSVVIISIISDTANNQHVISVDNRWHSYSFCDEVGRAPSRHYDGVVT